VCQELIKVYGTRSNVTFCSPLMAALNFAACRVAPRATTRESGERPIHVPTGWLVMNSRSVCLCCKKHPFLSIRCEVFFLRAVRRAIILRPLGFSIHRLYACVRPYERWTIQDSSHCTYCNELTRPDPAYIFALSKTMSILAQVNLDVPLCELCKKPIELTTTKIDENGKPVHEECYVQSIRSFLVEPIF
jgi:hypothetical protein